jgi:hypothetical protein
MILSADDCALMRGGLKQNLATRDVVVAGEPAQDAEVIVYGHCHCPV